MAADNPLCAEQFKNSDVAALKVVTDPGYEFAYWEMNGGIIQQASAEPLFLSTMPLFAGLVVVPTSRGATMKAHCLSVTLQSVTFAGMPAAVVKDDGTPYRAMPDAPLLGVSMPKAKPWRPNASRPHVFPCPAPSYSIFPKQFSCQFFCAEIRERCHCCVVGEWSYERTRIFMVRLHAMTGHPKPSREMRWSISLISATLPFRRAFSPHFNQCRCSEVSCATLVSFRNATSSMEFPRSPYEKQGS